MLQFHHSTLQTRRYHRPPTDVVRSVASVCPSVTASVEPLDARQRSARSSPLTAADVATCAAFTPALYVLHALCVCVCVLVASELAQQQQQQQQLA